VTSYILICLGTQHALVMMSVQNYLLRA